MESLTALLIVVREMRLFIGCTGVSGFESEQRVNKLPFTHWNKLVVLGLDAAKCCAFIWFLSDSAFIFLHIL